MNQELDITNVSPEQVDRKLKGKIKAEFKSVTATGVVLDNWKNAKSEYDLAKAKLDECKDAIVQHIGKDFSVGTNRFATDHFVLKANVNTNYTVDCSDLQMLNGALINISDICGEEVAQELLTWKPTLNKKVYADLPVEAKAFIDGFLTLKYNAPTFSAEELK